MCLEVFRIAKWSNDSKFTRTVGVTQHLSKETLGCLDLTPDLGIGDKQHLLRSEFNEARKAGLSSFTLNRSQISSECFANATIISDILSLGIFSIQLEIMSKQ